MSTGRFSGKRILITGGTSGIGLAGARKLAEEGAEILVTGVNEDRLAQARRELPSSAIVLRNDASDTSTGEQLLSAVKPGGLDGLWLNAGYADVAPVDRIDAQFFDRMMQTNVRGPVLQVAALCGSLNRGASVVVTSSTATYEGAAIASVYAASKAALIALSRCWASALAERGVRVNAVVPGPIETDFRSFMSAELRARFESDVVSRTALARVGSPQEAAAVALFLLSDEAAYITGSQYIVDGGLTKV
jgi:NAD(P)-dependent dehydrogenase (short-subunit alcohol dehydrogenase family)